jgi:hypothetical protein
MSRNTWNSTRVRAKEDVLIHAHEKGNIIIAACGRSFYQGRKYLRSNALVTCLDCYAAGKSFRDEEDTLSQWCRSSR